MTTPEIKKARAKVDEYFRLTNDLIGVFAFASALGCISTASPKLYAGITMAFCLIAYIDGVITFNPYIKLISTSRNRPRSATIFRKSIVALVGWLFLALTTAGVLNNEGVQKAPIIDAWTWISSWV